MRKFAVAMIAVAGAAGFANAQAFMDLEVNGLDADSVAVGGIATVSLWLDKNGSTAGDLANFTAWSQFAGQFHSTGGTWIAPAAETGAAGDTANGGSVGSWTAGRRPPAFLGVPGGSSGGFRFAPESYEVVNGGLTLRGAGDTANLIDGLAASNALGGFSQDTSTRLEVFRAEIDFTGAAFGTYDLSYTANILAVFIDSFFTERAVLSLASFSGATYTIVPAPASFALLGLGGVASLRRRRSI